MDNQHLRFTQGQYTVTTDPAFFQQEAIHDYLSQSSWAPGIDAVILTRHLRTAFVS